MEWIGIAVLFVMILAMFCWSVYVYAVALTAQAKINLYEKVIDVVSSHIATIAQEHEDLRKRVSSFSSSLGIIDDNFEALNKSVRAVAQAVSLLRQKESLPEPTDSKLKPN